LQLKEYQNLDREKRSLEYTVYDRELKENAAKLEAVCGHFSLATDSLNNVATHIQFNTCGSGRAELMVVCCPCASLRP
jgi:chromosome segregation ATPase